MKITLIGYGEVGKILAEDLRKQGLAVAAFDLKLLGEAGEPLREHALLHGVQGMVAAAFGGHGDLALTRTDRAQVSRGGPVGCRTAAGRSVAARWVAARSVGGPPPQT